MRKNKSDKRRTAKRCRQRENEAARFPVGDLQRVRACAQWRPAQR